MLCTKNNKLDKYYTRKNLTMIYDLLFTAIMVKVHRQFSALETLYARPRRCARMKPPRAQLPELCSASCEYQLSPQGLLSVYCRKDPGHM